MNRTFNADLWLHIKEDKEFLDKKVFFGLAPEDTIAPYCVMHVLDSGDDNSVMTLCSNDEGYNVAGVSDIQFSVYSTNDMQLDEILYYLNKMIKGIKETTEYRILSATRTVTKNASSFSNEVGTGISRFTFKYEHL